MPEQGTPYPMFHRDGASQNSRHSQALNPNHAQIDERTLRDRLVFLREYARELNYYNLENMHDGDWSGLLGDDINLDDVVKFCNDPQSVSDELATRLKRPHITLLLATIKLLELSQGQLNTFTQRHLDFYFKTLLGMQPRKAIADRVNLHFELEKNNQPVLLPKGLQLHAGKDVAGQPRVYALENDFLVNHGSIAECRSVFIDSELIGVEQAHKPAIEGSATREQAFMDMLSIALGQPHPGNALPPYPKLDNQTYAEINTSSLGELKKLVNFISSTEGLALQFSDFNELIALKKKREVAEIYDHDSQTVINEWAHINRILAEVGENNPDFTGTYTPADARDFDANLVGVLGETPDFSELIQVNSLTELYRKLLEEGRDGDIDKYPARTFVHEKLHFPIDAIFIDDNDTLNTSLSFEAMMKIKIRIDIEWTRINEILLEAEQKKNPSENTPEDESEEQSSIVPVYSADFENNFLATIGPVFSSPGTTFLSETITSLDQFHKAVVNLENYFFLPAADIAFLFNYYIIAGGAVTEPANKTVVWQTSYAILKKAHKNLALHQKTQNFLDFNELENPLKDMLTFMSVALKEYAKKQQISVHENIPDLDVALNQNDTVKAITEISPFLANDDITILLEIAKGENTQPDWPTVARAVAIAQRNMEGGDPVPQREQWHNLYAAEDAKQVRSPQAFIGAESTPSWPPFGATPEYSRDTGEEQSNAVREIGWGLSSPLFFLQQGLREIQLKLVFLEEGFDESVIEALLNTDSSQALPLRCDVSGETEWIEPNELNIELVPSDSDTEKCILATLKYHTSAPSLVASSKTLGIHREHPVLRVMLRQIEQAGSATENTGQYQSHYPAFRDLQLKRVECSVNVEGLTQLHLQNDHSVIDSSSPFEPFGTHPQTGSRFFMGHRELICKPLSSAFLNIEWMGLDNGFDFPTHYRNYSNDPLDFVYKNFKADFRLRDKSSGTKIFEFNERQLFAVKHDKNAIKFTKIDEYQPINTREFANEVKEWDRYLEWELGSPDFQHNNYLAASGRAALKLALEKDKTTSTSGDELTADDLVVNPPYTPKIKQLSVNYTSAITFDLSAEHATPNSEILHIHPFGYVPLKTDESSEENQYFLPRYLNHGELYIGLKDLQLPQSLSILFQLAEGTANPDIEPQPIHWSYLSNNQWLPLQGNGVVQDETSGLTQSGIIEFSLPQAEANTRMPSECYWLRASIAKHTESVSTVVALHTQAATVQFVDQNNHADHYASPLPADSIKRFVKPQPGIKKIEQPYTSFGGKKPEQETHFRTRVSERLRHKNRCITAWDFEHLVLENFPDIFKARCIPARVQNDTHKPGDFTLIVIPDIRNRIPFAPYAPKVSRAQLNQITQRVNQHKTLSAAVTVKNPFYIQVEVRLSVRFKQNQNERYYKHQLNEELKRFLSPWAYDEGADIIIGGKVYANNIIHFVEQRPYIDYVSNIKLFYRKDGDKNFSYKVPPPIDSAEGYFIDSVNDIEGQPHDGVLVAAEEHIIDTISEGGYQEETLSGIGHMKVEYDFQVK